MTYAAPLKVTIRLTVYAKDPETRQEERPRHQGTGSLLRRNSADDGQRHVHHQRHRARHRFASCTVRPGVFFERVPAQGYFLGKIIPYRGSWVEFEYDNKNLLYVRIDRKRKFYGSVFLRALGLKTDEQILRAFYRVSKISIKDKKLLLERGRGPDRPEALATPSPPRAARRWSRRARRSPPRVYQGNPEGQDRAGGSCGQRSRRRLRRRRRGRHVDRRSADRRQQRTDRRRRSAS